MAASSTRIGGDTVTRMRLHRLILACMVCTIIRAADAPPATQPARVVKQADDGNMLLHARDVVIHGTTVRYEPQPNKNTVGYWTKQEDWVSWEFEVTRPGTFTVIPLQGCGKGSGGAEVEFAVAGQKLKMTVEDTGGFQNFKTRDIGQVKLPAGRHTLSIKPLTKPGKAVMDLRQVELKLSGEK